ncbi:hypothetical protein KKF82_08295 [Patescibacteria group bacterium]|nr:hypothetical protein [Patescibacteria group bacterium]
MLNDDEIKELQSLPEGLHPINKQCPICGETHPVELDCPYCHSKSISILVQGSVFSGLCGQCRQPFPLKEDEEEGIKTVDMEDGTYPANQECPFCHSKNTILLVINRKGYGKCRTCGQPFIPK